MNARRTAVTVSQVRIGIVCLLIFKGRRLDASADHPHVPNRDLDHEIITQLTSPFLICLLMYLHTQAAKSVPDAVAQLKYTATFSG